MARDEIVVESWDITVHLALPWNRRAALANPQEQTD